METFKPESNSNNENNSPSILIRGTDGKVVDLFKQLERESNTEKKVSASVLNTGDFILAESEDGQKIVVRFISYELNNLGLGTSQPRKVWKVEINDTDTKTKKEATFIGSSFGGSMLMPNTLGTNRFWVFRDDEGEFNLPAINKFSLVHGPKSESLSNVYSIAGNVEGVDLELQETHEQRVQEYTNLVEKFGFAKAHDPLDCTRSLPEDLTYKGWFVVANYAANMAGGNSLAIYNKKTRDYICYEYYNYQNEDILQVSWANLKNHDYNPAKFMGSVNLSTSGIHIARTSIITHATSPSSGINAINYQVSAEEAKTLGAIKEREFGAPDLIITPTEVGQQISIPDSFSLAMNLRENPDLIETIKRVTSVTEENGQIYLNIGDKKIKIPTTSDIYKKATDLSTIL